LPQRTPWYQSWSQGISFGALQTPFNQEQWPNPSPVSWYQSWTSFGNSLTSVIQNPFLPGNIPNPYPITWYQSWIQSGFLFPTPFFQNVNSPLPVVFQPIDQTWIQSLNLFYQSETFPNVQRDWPNPLPIGWYRSLEESGNALTFVSGIPFFQTDWPLPKTVQPIDQFWFNSLTNLPKPTPFLPLDWPNPPRVIWDRFWSQSLVPGALQRPFNQSDWPLPYPVQWYKDWYQALALYFPTVFPFYQVDWPNPRTYSPIDQFWTNNLNLLPKPSTAQPFAQYDWPNPKDYQRIDENFWQALALILPSPPPPPEQDFSGRTWTKEEWTKKLTQYARSRLNPSAVHLGRLGGIASGISRRK
jgi:hypothetical protein